MERSRSSSWRCVLAALSLLVGGCAARKNIGSPSRVIIPNDCITSLNVTPQTYCEISPKHEVLCHHATVTHAAGCEQVEVKSKEKK